MSSQTVYFDNPADIQQLKSNQTYLSMTGSFTAVSNASYSVDMPFIAFTGSVVPVTITFPAAPVGGDKICLIDGSNVWGNRYYNLTINFNGKTASGDCADGKLFAARRGEIMFVYNSAKGQWKGTSRIAQINNNILTANSSVTTSNELPYHGWWLFADQDTSSNQYGCVTEYIFIDQTMYPAKAYLYRIYGGLLVPDTTNNATTYDLIPDPRNSSYLIYNKNILYGLDTVDSALVDFQFRITADKQTLYMDLGSAPETSRICFFGPMVPARYIKIDNIKDQPELLSVQPILSSINNNVHMVLNDNRIFDPIKMAKEIFRANLRLGHGMNKNIGQDEDNIGDYYLALQAFDDFCAGVQFITPIKQIQCSYSGPNNVWGGNGSTLMTDLYTEGNNHYCTPGSNVTISGFSGAWSSMNGYYPNGVSYFETCCMKTGALNGHNLDGLITNSNGGMTGSAVMYYNKILLIKDTGDVSLYPRSSETGSLGKAIFTGSPTISVVHRFTTGMQYNEWCAALLALLVYVFGPQTHTRFSTHLADRNLGKLFTNWDYVAGATNTSVTLRTRENSFVGASEVSIQPTVSFYHKYRWGNDPYQALYYINSYFYSGTQFGTTAPRGYEAPIPLLNYMTGSPMQLYVSLDGTGTQNRVQRFVSSSYGCKNASDINITGGQYVTAQLIPRNQITPSYPNPLQWTLNGNTVGSANITSTVNRLNYIYASIINPVYTPGKKVGYFPMYDSGACITFTNYYGMLNEVTPPLSYPTQYTGCMAALSIAGKLIKYFNVQGCDSIIIDSRANAGGIFPGFLGSLFGGDRKGTKFYQSPFTDGYGTLKEASTYSDSESTKAIAYSCDTIKPSDVERNLPGSVFKGSTGAAKKIVFMNSQRSGSGGDLISRIWQGDNYDGNIGSNTFAKIIGEMDGRLCGAAGLTQLPQLSSTSDQRLKSVLGRSYTLDNTQGSLLHQSATGPDGKLIWLNQRSNYVATSSLATGSNQTIRSVVPGATTLPNGYADTLYKDWGIWNISSTEYNSRYLTADGRPQPNKLDPSTWRDIWLEQAIREACVLGM